jgi:hypothetical protein
MRLALARRGCTFSFTKAMKKVAKFLLIVAPWAVLLCLGLLYLWSNLFSFPWVWQEKGRVRSPSGACELVTYEGNRGAMSSFAYVSFLVVPGGKSDPNACDYYAPVLSTSHTAPKPRWADSDRLIIGCDGGYVTHVLPYSREFNVAIEITGAENPSRAAGQ